MKKVIGVIKGEGIVKLEMEIRESTRVAQTVDHRAVEGYKTLSICGEIRERGMREGHSFGQIHDSLRNATWEELNMPKEHIEEILDIWEEWHLNDMNAGCCHQDTVSTSLDNWSELAAAETAKCPHGYRYGSAWLLRELPSEVEQRIIELFQA